MGVTPYYSIYSPFFPDPVLPTRNFSILKSPPVQQEAHHALWGGGRYLPCASNRLGQNQLVPFGTVVVTSLVSELSFPFRRTAEAWGAAEEVGYAEAGGTGGGEWLAGGETWEDETVQ